MLKYFGLSIIDQTAYRNYRLVHSIDSDLENNEYIITLVYLIQISVVFAGLIMFTRVEWRAQNFVTINKFTSLINDIERGRCLGAGFKMQLESGTEILLNGELKISLRFSDHTLIYQNKILVLTSQRRKSILI